MLLVQESKNKNRTSEPKLQSMVNGTVKVLNGLVLLLVTELKGKA